MTNTSPERKDIPDPVGETLKERSERLEAEALRGQYAGAAQDEPQAAPETAPPTADLQAMQIEMAQVKEHAMRALAEADNIRKRAMREREDATKFAVSGFARDLLNVADNLRRALDAVPADLAESDARIKNLLEGIGATERELLRSFEKNGIQKVDPAGQPFNPNFHEVMFESPGTGKPGGTVIQVIETGYMIHDRLLRPARVGVAKDEGQGSGPAHPGGNLDTQA